MFRHLLVPLDGSELAEAALPVTVTLARRLGASVTLVHIIEHHAPGTIHGQPHLTGAGEAEAYLASVARSAFPAGIPVTWHVHTAESTDLPGSILEHVEELSPDLVIMCTHGRGGLRQWLFGSIAQRVVASGDLPVVLVRPAEGAPHTPYNCRSLLVPLDGSPEHERGLPLAAGLARACAAELHLLLVVPTPADLYGQQAATGRILPGATRAVLELSQQSAQVYLAERRAWLQAHGLVADVAIREGDAATAIAEMARDTAASMIVLGTHGRAGIDAFWAGSIAPRVSTLAQMPLLLVPVRVA